MVTAIASPYARPPIIEAVIDIRFGAPLSGEELARVSEAFAGHYPSQQEQKDREFHLAADAAGQPQVQAGNETVSFLRAADDQREAVILKPSVIAVVDRAPYGGWDAFLGRFQRDWGIWLSMAGPGTITRIGMRYINRIDIPAPADSPVVHQEEYVTVHVHSPEDKYGPTSGYEVRAVYPLASIGGRFLLHTTVLGPPPPKPGCLSVLLDFDLARDQAPPQDDAAIMALLASMRDEKNRIFEAAITDKARALFQ